MNPPTSNWDALVPTEQLQAKKDSSGWSSWVTSSSQGYIDTRVATLEISKSHTSDEQRGRDRTRSWSQNMSRGRARTRSRSRGRARTRSRSRGRLSAGNHSSRRNKIRGRGRDTSRSWQRHRSRSQNDTRHASGLRVDKRDHSLGNTSIQLAKACRLLTNYNTTRREVANEFHVDSLLHHVIVRGQPPSSLTGTEVSGNNLKFKFGLEEFVKDIAKSTWKQDQISTEDHNTIAKKVAGEMISAIEGARIPKTEEDINRYLSSKKLNITNLVQAHMVIFRNLKELAGSKN